jgi:voltage-gated potassium channel
VDEKRFIIMSVVLVCTFILSPFFYHYPFAGVLLRVFFSLLMISAVYACTEKGRALIVALPLMVVAVLAEWIGYFTAIPELSLVGRVAAALFLAHVIRIIVRHMIHARKVNANLIFGAISVYLLIGVFWAMACSALEVAQPESFTVKPLTVADDPAASPETVPLHRFTYYSLVTLTTLGYGDIVPVTPSAQVASSLEAVVGQLYLTILVAGLVGLHVSQRQQ